MAEEQIQKLKNADRSKQYKIVFQYNKNGVFIKEWQSVKEAVVTLGLHHISAVALNKRKTSGNYIWKYK